MFSQWVIGNLRFQHEILGKICSSEFLPYGGGLAAGEKEGEK